MRFIYITILFIFISISCPLSAQMRFAWTTSPDTVLVKSNKFQITIKDLHERIITLNLLQMPFYRTIEGQKQILESMIYECTFTTHAHELQIDQLPLVTEAIYNDASSTTLQLYLQDTLKSVLNFNPTAIDVFYHEGTDLEVFYPMALLEYFSEGENQEKDDKLMHPSEILRIEPDKRIRNSESMHSEVRIHLFRESDFERTLERPFTEIRDEIEAMLIEKNRESLFRTHIQNLTEKYGVTTNTELLKNMGVGDGDRYSTYESFDPEYQLRYNERFWGVQSITAPEEMRDQIAVKSEYPELQMTLYDIELLFRNAASKEILLTTLDSPKIRKEIIENELEKRMLNLAMKEAETFEKYYDSLELKTARSNTILGYYEELEINNKIIVTPEEINELYQKNIQNHTYPAYRNIRQFVSKNKKEAKKHAFEFNKMLSENETAKIVPYINQYSLNPENYGYILEIYNDGIMPGIGYDKAYNKLVWELGINKLSPIFNNSKNQYVFFYVVYEKPELIRPLKDYENYYRQIIFQEKVALETEKLQNELQKEFEVAIYTNKIQSAILPNELFLYAERARNRGDYEDMIAFLEYIIRDFPDTEDANDALVMIAVMALEDLDNREMAISALEGLVKNAEGSGFYEEALFLLDALYNDKSIDDVIWNKINPDNNK